MKSKPPVALVTVASSGIGEPTAVALAAAVYTVYGTSRRGVQSAQRAFKLLALDVTSDESVDAAVNELLQLEGRIDLPVNNAGFGVSPSAAEESSIEQAKAILDTNCLGVVRMTRTVLPHMRQQGGGRIINIGSIIGLVPTPYAALHAASKHAVEGYSEAVDHELRSYCIHVTVIEPAYTKAQFEANNLAPMHRWKSTRRCERALATWSRRALPTQTSRRWSRMWWQRLRVPHARRYAPPRARSPGSCSYCGGSYRPACSSR
ncbi:SDR family NAD(P)-dependent oxidoreductase [Xanthomonas oryzae]|uniref:SDR family NAD(P)-dependent oxidoreductase n=1 Tax=Xanthomonas oryzae TaxID=347 RepID=UPI000A80BC91|nr:SDR family NAD(P)-dependent oxidoreductase [Xanthomonas oryzae]UWI55584.1 SDR family NAD(P)-dependent oxidoreductase [Xanthomonas oryzae pv. oryzae]